MKCKCEKCGRFIDEVEITQYDGLCAECDYTKVMKEEQKRHFKKFTYPDETYEMKAANRMRLKDRIKQIRNEYKQ